MLIESFITISILVALISSVFFALRYFRFLRELLSELKTNHKEIWIKLNKPTMEWSASATNAPVVMKYLISKDYLGTKDVKFIKLSNTARFSLIAYFSLLIYLIFAVVIANVTNVV